jgi:hypothetical protein
MEGDAMKRAYYNEPLKAPRGDVIPTLTAVKAVNLNATVKSRLILEKALRQCGLAAPGPSIKVTVAVRKILVSMLTEIDSPFSASLRARAASAVGQFGIKEATGIVRRIALDETEDLSTRVGAVGSYLRLKGVAAAKDLNTLLVSKAWQVRASAYTEVLNSPSWGLRSIGEERFKREHNAKVKAYVTQRVYAVRAEGSTADDE